VCTSRRVLFFALLAPAGLGGCSLAENYDDPAGPRYAGSYSTDTALAASEFTLASFNIEFAEEIELAAEELRTNAALAGASVLLLQEMDAEGTDRIARELGYDYVYYPGSVHHEKDFGNAVLSRWPIAGDEKLILPHRNPSNGRIRIAVGATLDTPEGPLAVWSVHSDTMWLGPRGRLEQARAVIEAAAGFDGPVAIGGDFNTLEEGVVEETGAEFERAGYTWATAGLGPSTESALGMVRLDHVFVKGLRAHGAATHETQASDHQPLWVELERALPE
jgi:endonuclease/exonuclease/phosphatase family metal-dependent hydrolase